MNTHHCRECGAQVDEFCAEHPKAIVDTIVSRSGRSLTDAERARNGYGRITLRLPTDSLAMLGDLAHERGESRAETVDSLIRAARAKLKETP